MSLKPHERFGYMGIDGRGSWIRTNGCRDQNPVPYHLAIPLNLLNPEMAGVAGVEPTDTLIKTRCLTTWRDPYQRTNQAGTGRGSINRNKACRNQEPVTQ